MPASKISSAISVAVRWDILAVVTALTLLSAISLWFVFRNGYVLYYGDAEAHLNHARRIVDSRTPGADELGTVWLPLPHLLMTPFVVNDDLWRSGLAGSIPSAACFVLAGAFLFASVKLAFASGAAAFAGAASLALNPNLLYLQSTPMGEPVFLACLMVLLYCTVRFRRTQSLLAVVGAGLASCAGSLTRYEGWFLIPFVAIYFLFAADRRRIPVTAIFLLLAAAGPLAWIAHNWWYSGDFLDFYRGPNSARAIQGAANYPGKHNLGLAWLQFRTTARLALGAPLVGILVAGSVAGILKKTIWPLLLLALIPPFYIWNIYSGVVPIFVPPLNGLTSYYNTRYALALLPLAAFAAAALVAWAPEKLRIPAAIIVIVAGIFPWLMDARMENVLTWKESQVNSVARRAWTNQAAEYLRSNYRPGSGVFTTFGDISAIYRQAGIPLRDTLTWDNWPVWPAVAARPDLFLRDEWAVAQGGDPVQSAVNRAFLRGPRYTLQKTIAVKGAPVLEIYRRDSQRGLAGELP